MNAGPQIALVEADERQSRGKETMPPTLAPAVEHLAAGGVVLLRLSPVPVRKREAIARAEAALRTIRLALTRRHGLPRQAYVEIDEESHGVPVAPFRRNRFLLPHQDGGHCSFLTPSRLDCPEVSGEDRVFSASVYWRRPSHKVFQGFLVTEPGEPPGKTCYYNALALLCEAFIHRHGRDASGVAELARFGLDNLRRAKALQPTHGSRYLTPGAFLGSGEPSHHVLPSGPRAESEFWPGQYANLPELCELAEICPCGACLGPGDRVLCHATSATLGKSWPQVRNDHEATATAARYDLLLANNLTLYHGADSQSSRTIIPMCIVLDRAGGATYERWLAAQWRTNGAGLASAANSS